VRDLDGFRQAVRERRRAAGRTQQQLAGAIGLNPDVLSHKLHQRGALLSAVDVIAIATALARWGAITSVSEVRSLLALMDVPAHAIPPDAWAAQPLSALLQDPVEPGADPAAAAAPAAAAPAVAAPAVAAPGADQLAADLPFARMQPAPLPVPLTRLIGRAAEVAAVILAVRESRLVTLTGPGGAGKTRIALRAAAELARQFGQGVAFADLADVQDGELLPVTLLRAIGHTPVLAAAAEAQLVAALEHASLLLVADNLEHLTEQAPLLNRLLAASPGLRVIATSRVPLGLYGERQLRVPPLGLPARDSHAGSSEAVQLFVERARAALPEFQPDAAGLAAVAGICRAVDGLALAIELAAALIKLFPPAALLPRLTERLALLTGGPRDAPHRQQTLRATLDWSEALLPEACRRIFPCLGVFAGPFDAAAAAAVCGDARASAALLGDLAVLAEHSLLDITPGQTPRFAMLATVREYALEKLAGSGQLAQAYERLLGHLLGLALPARSGFEGAQQGAWLDRLEAEFANVRACLDWARAHAEASGACLDDGLRLAIAVAPVWRRRGSLAEGALYLDRLLSIDDRVAVARPETRAWALLEASALACFRGDYPATAALAAAGAELCGGLADQPGLAWAERYQGEAALAVGELGQAAAHFDRQFELARQAGDVRAEAAARNMLGQVLRYQHRYPEARWQLRQALRSFQVAGDPDGQASVLNSIGEVARDAGKPAVARSYFQQALAGHQQTGSRRGMAADLEGLACATALADNGRAALVYLGAAQSLRELSGGPLPPVEQAILTALIDAGTSQLAERERQQALAEGRDSVLADVISAALQEPGDRQARPVTARAPFRAP
jgi:predicted ATPase